MAAEANEGAGVGCSPRGGVAASFSFNALASVSRAFSLSSWVRRVVRADARSSNCLSK